MPLRFVLELPTGILKTFTAQQKASIDHPLVKNYDESWQHYKGRAYKTLQDSSQSVTFWPVGPFGPPDPYTESLEPEHTFHISAASSARSSLDPFHIFQIQGSFPISNNGWCTPRSSCCFHQTSVASRFERC